MALALEIIPPAMYEDGHSTHEDYEIHILRSIEQAKEVFDTEARKLVTPYDSEFMGWIMAIDTQNLLQSSLQNADRFNNLHWPHVDADIAGFHYRLSSYRSGKH